MNYQRTERPRILVVEDEAIVSADVQQRLGKLGYAIAGAADTGERAIMLAAQLKPDLILMDIVLRGPMRGTQAAKIIRETSKLPVVFLTANSDEDTLVIARDADPFGYLLKPFEDRSLRIAIEIALYKHALERDRDDLIRQLKDALLQVKTLSGLLPICAWCKSIRDDHGYWKNVEEYLRDHSDASFSHGVCPKCSQQLAKSALEDRGHPPS